MPSRGLHLRARQITKQQIIHGVEEGWMEGVVISGALRARFFCFFLNQSQELDFIIWDMRPQFR